MKGRLGTGGGRLGLGAVAVVTLCASLLAGRAGPSTAAADGAVACDTALVAIPDLNELIPVDIGAGTLGTPISLDGAYQVAITPDGHTAWVLGDHASAPVWTITPVDLGTGTVGSSIPLGAGTHGGPVITPDGHTLLLGSSDHLDRLDLATRTLEAPIAYPPESSLAAGMAVTPDGRTALVGNESGSLVSLSIDLTTGTLGPSFAPGGYSMAVAPDGRTAYVGNGFFPMYNAVDLPSLEARPEIHVAVTPLLMAVTPDGDKLVLNDDGGVEVVDLANGKGGPLISAGNGLGQAITPDGGTDLVVTEAPNQLLPVDLATGKVGTPIDLPGTPLAVAPIVPDQAPTAQMVVGPAQAGTPTRFDASASAAECGSIASYRWDFGDGSPVQTTTSPVVEHTYAISGSYTARLIVTDSSGTSTAVVFTGQATNRNGAPRAATVASVQVAAHPVTAAPAFTG